jgi:hypothetical protein
MADLAILETSQDHTTVVEPEVRGNMNADDDNARPKVSIQKLVMLPKVWAPYFLEPQSPWEALQTYKTLIQTIPAGYRDSFDFLEAWLHIACTHQVRKDGSVLKAKWQNPHADQQMIKWMLRHTQCVNFMPMMMETTVRNNLDPQEYFNKALETVAALKPVAETKKYRDSPNAIPGTTMDYFKPCPAT